jgi:hypothetical protein
MPYPVQNLIEGRGLPVTAQPNDSAADALKLMIEHDYSQLPVIDEGRHPLGMVTHESILRALSNFGLSLGELRVSNAIVKAHKYYPEDDLFDLLDRLKETNAVLIVDSEQRLIGIVTSYDSTEYFRRRAEDMMVVEDIEGMVKDLVLAAFVDQTGEANQAKLRVAIEEVTSPGKNLKGRYKNALKCYLELQGQKPAGIDSQSLESSFEHLAPKEDPKEFEDLTLYEYSELLLQKGRWHLYQEFFGLEADALRKLLSDVRETRNALAHFRPEISATQRDQLRFCAEWLAQHSADRLQQTLAGIPVTWPMPVETGEKEPSAVGVDACPAPAGAEDAIVPTEESLGPEDSRYAPLALWLQSCPSKDDRVSLTFEQVEQIIGGDLPESARTHRAWWANDSVAHVQSKQWLEVGWRVAQTSMAEERVTFARVRERESAYIAFFSELLNRLRKRGGLPTKGLGPDGCSWHTVTGLPEPGLKCMHFVFAFARGGRFRVELYIDTGRQDENKRIFDWLYAERDRLHEALGEDLTWERLDAKRASRIAWYRPGAITDDSPPLAQLQTWAADAMVRFYKALAEPAVQALAAAEQDEQGTEPIRTSP